MRENTFFDNAVLETLPLDEIARLGAQSMLKAALSAELDAFMSSMGDCRLSDGRPAVVRIR